MAKGRIEQEIALKVTGAKDVKEAARIVDELDGETATVKVGVDSDQGVKDVKSFTALIDGLSDEDKTIVLKAQTDQAEREVKKLTAMLGKAKDAETIRVKVELLGNARAKLDELRREVNDLDGETVDIHVEASGLDEISDQLGALPGVFGQIGSALGPLAAGGGAAAGAGALGLALVGAGNAAADLAIEAGTYATLTGAAVEDASRLLTVIKSTGLEYNDLADITVQVNQALETTPELAERLGIDLDDGKNAAERLLQVIKLNEQGLLSMTDASTLFGEEGIRQMARVKLTIDDITRAMLDLPEGAIVNQDDVERAAEMQREMAKAAIQIQAVATDLGQEVVPYMEKAAEYAQLINTAFDTLNFDIPDLAGTDMGSLFTNLIPGVQTLTRIKQGFGLVRSGLQEIGVVGRATNAVFDDFAGGDFADAVDDTSEALVRNARAHERNMFRINQHREAQEAAVEAQKEAAEAYTDWADAAAEANRVLASGPTIEGAVAGAGKLLDQMFGLTRIASANEAAFDALGETLKENGHTFDLNTEKGRANQQVLESLAESLIPQIAANYKNAAGDLQSFVRQMDALKMGVFRQLQSETDLTDRQIRDVIQRLGIFDGAKYSAQFELLGLEDAESKVALLLPLLETLQVSPDIVRTIALQVAAGDPEGALRSIQSGINNAPKPAVVLTPIPPTDRELANASTATSNRLKQFPAKLPVVPFLDTRSISQRAARAFFENLDSGGTAEGFGAIAGERGPEILNDRYLTTGPTYVPPGTRVTSRRQTNIILRRGGNLKRYDAGGTVPFGPITVNFNGVGTIGNTADVDRQVRRSLQRIERIYGTR